MKFFDRFLKFIEDKIYICVFFMVTFLLIILSLIGYCVFLDITKIDSSFWNDISVNIISELVGVFILGLLFNKLIDWKKNTELSRIHNTIKINILRDIKSINTLLNTHFYDTDRRETILLSDSVLFYKDKIMYSLQLGSNFNKREQELLQEVIDNMDNLYSTLKSINISTEENYNNDKTALIDALNKLEKELSE